MQTGMVICGAIGLDTDLSFAYQLFALLACILVAARISLRFQVPAVSVRRHLPRYATAGEPFEYSITVINEGERVERDLDITDNPRVVPPEFEQFQRSREPGEETRNAYDRWIGFHRFIWLQRLNTGITISKSKLPDVRIKSSATATMKATPLRRGKVQFESTTILHPDPLSLNYGVIDLDNREQLIVLPRRYPVARRFESSGQRHFESGGVNSTWSIGESEEFVALRDYRDGDALRKIHWPSTARSGLPVVREYQDEYFVRQMLVVDTCQADPNVFEDTITVAASLLGASDDKPGAMDLCFMTDRPEFVTAGPGHAQTSLQLEALALLTASKATPDMLIQPLADRSSMISRCLLVFAGIDAARLELLEAVENCGVRVEVFVVTDAPDSTLLRDDFHILEPGRIRDDLAKL